MMQMEIMLKQKVAFKAYKGQMEYILSYGKIPPNTKWLP